MKKRPVYNFSTEAETGINKIPNGSVVIVENYNSTGTKVYTKESDTGTTVSTTVAQAITALNLKEIMGGGGSSVRGVVEITATSGQTVFTTPYTVGFMDLMLNGVMLSSTDYQATNGTSITLVSPANLGDLIMVVTYSGTSLADTYTQAQINAKPTGFKNFIINGNFDVWQRGDSQTTVNTYGSDDRWNNSFNGTSTRVHSKVYSEALGGGYISRTAVTSAVGVNNYVVKLQYIEDVTKLAGKTVTLSFWAKADSNKNIAIEFIQAFGTGGVPSANTIGIGAQKIALTNTWQKNTITVTIPSIVGKTLGTDGVHTSVTGLVFWFDAGSAWGTRSANLGQQSGTFDIAQVQIEEGSVATPFEQRPYGLELSLCQRYYEKSFSHNIPPSNGTATTFSVEYGNMLGIAVNTNAGSSIVPFKVEKRVIPTITNYGNSSGNWCYTTATSASYVWASNSLLLPSRVSTSGFSISQQAIAQQYVSVLGHWTASAEI